MVVASVVDGRVRIRDEGLKSESVAGRVRDELLATEGVTSVEGNPRVGSLLVLYNAARTALENILKAVSGILGTGHEGRTEGAQQGEPKQSWWKKVMRPEQGEQSEGEQGEPVQSWWRQMLAKAKVSPAASSVMKRRVMNNIGMLASLTLSLLAALFSFKKLHILSGLVFVALFGEHFYQRRARMLR